MEVSAMPTFFHAVVICLMLAIPCSVRADEAQSLQTIGTMGKGQRVLKGEQEAVLYEYTGAGCLTHFWFGGNFDGVENTRIRYYVDGEETPSIDMNLYMGHGVGFNNNDAPWATKHIGKIGKTNGFYNNYRIPFGKSIRVTAQRAADAADSPRMWWIIRGVENLRVMLGGVTLPETARLKLIRLENHEVAPMKEFVLCNVKGNGALYQVTIAAKATKGGARFNYLEACMRAYMGGSEQPVMLSSGLEDYFLGTYYFDTGKYHADIAGLTHIDAEKGEFSAYRFHDQDPVFFRNGLRLTCRNGETQHGTIDGPPHSKPPTARYTTYVWLYQW